MCGSFPLDGSTTNDYDGPSSNALNYDEIQEGGSTRERRVELGRGSTAVVVVGHGTWQRMTLHAASEAIVGAGQVRLERMSVVDLLRRLSAPDGDAFSEPTGEPCFVDVACGDGEHCVDSLVGVGL